MASLPLSRPSSVLVGRSALLPFALVLVCSAWAIDWVLTGASWGLKTFPPEVTVSEGRLQHQRMAGQEEMESLGAQNIFMEHPLCARPWARCGKHNGD